MLRGYRRYILAALGCLIVAASPPRTEAGSEQKQADKAVTQPLNQLAAALEKANEPSVANEPCHQGEDNRESDLCAQWKAADSAASAASAAWVLGIFGTVIGAATLIAAIAAARFARDAAIHTEAGAIESKRAADAAEAALLHTREVTQMQLRAYLELDHLVLEEMPPGDDPNVVRIKDVIRLKNFGSTPARHVELKSMILMGSEKIKERGLSFPGIENDKGTSMSYMAQGDFLELGVRNKYTSEQWAAVKSGAKNIYLLVEYAYEDMFGARHERRSLHETEDFSRWSFCHEEARDHPPKEYNH